MRTRVRVGVCESQVKGLWLLQMSLVVLSSTPQPLSYRLTHKLSPDPL